MKKFIKNFKQNSHISPLYAHHSGITLVALVVTIVVLLILAGVTITVLLGDDGIFKKAENAANATNEAVQSELEGINSLADKINEIVGGGTGDETGGNEEDPDGGDDNPPATFEPTETPEPPTGGEEMTNMKNGIIEIKWLSGTSNNVSEEPNEPVIKTDFTDGTTMEQVVFDEGRQEWIVGTEYSYVAGIGTNDNTSSKWANARVTKNGVESYFVWIPRYAYRIIYFNSLESKQAYQNGTLTEEEAIADKKIIGYSDSRGIVDAQGRKIEEVTSESNSPKLMVSQDYFMVHPAFTSEVENGGWNTELAGIWVGKYETSSVEGNSNSSSGDNTTSKTAKVQPGVSSWRYIEIGNMYKVSYNYARDLESHMLKNSEWGAVAYLTESKYGRNGTEVTINNSSSYYTGGGSGTAYITHVSQSSTGNVYGIYDLSGNASEYVAAGCQNTISIGTSKGSSEYGTAYRAVRASVGYKYGDATYETSAWHSDYTYFVALNAEFFSRGGGSGEGIGAGVFATTNFTRRHQDRPLLVSPRLSIVM